MKRFRYLIAIALFILRILPAAAQESETIPLTEAIASQQRANNVRFFFKPEWLQEIRINRASAATPLSDFLDRDLANAGFSYTRFHDGVHIVLFKGNAPDITIGRITTVSAAADTTMSDAFVLSGTVLDGITGEPLAGATVLPVGTSKGVNADAKGFFSVQLSAGVYEIRVTAVGKTTTTRRITLDGDVSLNVDLFEQVTELDNITITSEAMSRNVTATGMSQINLDIKTMKSIPPFMGEADVIKSILLMPGVSTVGEGASGFNVRGGNVDQNLILLDETPLYNSSHLFGFFSAFNPDFVRDVTLYKGGMPASFGGRISSVLDIKLKDGNGEKFSGAGGIGIVTSRLQVEGPVSKKTTFIVGGRIAYPDWMLATVPDLNVSRSSGSFYDANLRVRHQFNSRNVLQLSAYRSADQFKFAADTTYGWSSTNMSLKWNTTISEKIFGSATLIYARYQNDVSGIKPGTEFDATFGVLDRGGKVDFTWLPDSRNKIDFGMSFTEHTFNTGTLVASEGSSINDVLLPEERSAEHGYYISDEFKLNEKVSLQAGVRYSWYAALGAARVYLFNPELPRRVSSIVDTLFFAPGENVQTYSGWEPRASLKFATGEHSSVKVSYNRNYQYVQLISNTTAVSPLDLWKSSGYNIKPQIGSQVAAGYFMNFMNNGMEFSVEGYYKQLDNLLEYKDGANLFLNQYLEADLLYAKGWSYGVETMIRKNHGKLTGWVAYTYSRSIRQVAGRTTQEFINFGKKYPSNFDKPNDMTIVGRYAFTRRLSIAANFTYSTGRPTTSPQSVYVVNGYSFAQFSQRNQARIPDYHRLDLSFSIDESLRRNRKWKGNWTFAVYNAYGRRNAYSVFFKPQYRGSQTQSYRLSVVGTILPSITYNFRF